MAWRYVKIVPPVPAVPTFQTITLKPEKNTHDNIPISKVIVPEVRTASTTSTKPKENLENEALRDPESVKETIARHL